MRLGAITILVVMAGATGCAGVGHRAEAGGAEKVTVEQARERMVRAARAVYRGILAVEDIRPRSPEFLEMKVEWSRRLADAEAAVPDRFRGVDPYEDHLMRLKAMQPLSNSDLDGGWPGRLQLFDYALAEAEFRVMRRHAGPEGWEGLAPAKAASEARMQEDAKQVYAGLLHMSRDRPMTPEFLEMCVAWSRREGWAETLLQGTPAGRLPALRAHYDRMKALETQVKGMEATLGRFEWPQLEYAVAEAEYMVEINLGNNGTLTEKQQSAAKRMEQAADAALQVIYELEELRPRTPEFLQVQMTLSQRLAEAGMVLHASGAERQKVLESYLKRTKRTSEVTRSVLHTVVPNLGTDMADYAVAQAEYWVAME